MATPSPRTPVVGRLRFAHQLQGVPQSLDTWRVTTDDPTVADAIHRVLGGSAPRCWPGSSKDTVEVVTATAELNVIFSSAKSFETRFVRSNSDPNYVSTGDAFILPDGSRVPDPDRELSLLERRRRARDTGERPVTSLYCQLAAAPDLGTLLFRSTSWDLAERLRRADITRRLEAAGRDVPATLRISKTPTGRATLSHATAHLLLND